MVIQNISDWDIKKCLIFTWAVILAMWSLAGLADLGYNIPILRPIVVFVFLTFFPGMIMLRILKLHNLRLIETIIYSIGLSTACVMFGGAFANFVLPLAGFSRPISELIIMTTLTVFMLLASLIAFLRDKNYSAPKPTINLTTGVLSSSLLLLALPIIAVIGAQFVNHYENNIPLIVLIILMAGVVALVIFDIIPEKAYLLAIAMIALSLLLHISLISDQLSGSDIHGEYFFASTTVKSGHWDFSTADTYNTALSVVMIAPIYALLMNVEIITVFKVVYPLIFMFVPLILYLFFYDQVGGKRAFLSVFFLMLMPMFVGNMTAGVRSQIAQLFFALLLWLTLDQKLSAKKRAGLFIVFCLSLIVSHYSMGYIYFIFLIGSWVILLLVRNHGRVIWKWATRRFGGIPENIFSKRAFPFTIKIMLAITGIYLAFVLCWYGLVAQGAVLDKFFVIAERQQNRLSVELPNQNSKTEVSGVLGKTSTGPNSTSNVPGKTSSGPNNTSNIPGETSSGLAGAILDPEERETLVGTALGLDFTSSSLWGKVFRVFQYLTELFIVIGFLATLLRPKGFKFKLEYIALSIIAALILLVCVVVPPFSVILNITRFYQITLFLLAPFCVVGGEIVWQGIAKLSRYVRSVIKERNKVITQRKTGNPGAASLRFVTVAVLIPYFLFSSGFIAEVTRNDSYPGSDMPHSWALSNYRLDMPVFDGDEAKAAAWLVQNINDKALVYTDFFGRLPLNDQMYNQSDRIGLIPNNGKIPDEAYVFLRKWNVQKAELLLTSYKGAQRIQKHISFSQMQNLFSDRKVVYQNASAQILAPVGKKQ